MSRLTRDGTAEPISRDQILRHARGQGNIIFPVQLTTSRIGNLTRLIHTLLYVMTIHTYIHHTYKVPMCLFRQYQCVNTASPVRRALEASGRPLEENGSFGIAAHPQYISARYTSGKALEKSNLPMPSGVFVTVGVNKNMDASKSSEYPSSGEKLSKI